MDAPFVSLQDLYSQNERLSISVKEVVPFSEDAFPLKHHAIK
jgi:hypothetical protein